MSSSPTLGNGLSKTAIAEKSPTHLIIQMALRDVSVLFRTPWIIITRALAFIVQLFVFANLISGLIHIPRLNYYEYYAVGSVVATIASISFVIGYDIFEEAEEGVLDYLLTLPISRREFIIGRALGGAMRAIIYTIPMFVIVAVVWGFNQPLSILTALLSLFLLAFGVTGMSITVAVSVKSATDSTWSLPSWSSRYQEQARLSTRSVSYLYTSRFSLPSHQFRLPRIARIRRSSISLSTFPQLPGWSPSS